MPIAKVKKGKLIIRIKKMRGVKSLSRMKIKTTKINPNHHR